MEPGRRKYKGVWEIIIKKASQSCEALNKFKLNYCLVVAIIIPIDGFLDLKSIFHIIDV